MEQFVWVDRVWSYKGAPIVGKKVLQERMSARIAGILSREFHHPHAPIMKTTLKNIPISELMAVYNFLIMGTINTKNQVSRPECPIVSPKHQSLGKIEYKEAMCNYIKGFGYDPWNKNPCTYTPAFLEALANYLEYRTGRGGIGQPRREPS